MDIMNNNMLSATRTFNQQQIQKNHATMAQQRLRQEVIQNSSPEGASTVKPQSSNFAGNAALRSRYMFAIGDDGKRVLRLQIDLSPSTLSVLA